MSVRIQYQDESSPLPLQGADAKDWNLVPKPFEEFGEVF
jgi:hypothetical protein